jgi:hypothetical protein
MSFYKSPSSALNKLRKQMSSKPDNIKEEAKRAWRLCRIKKKFPFKLSTVKLSHEFKCSENLICLIMRINKKDDNLPSYKIWVKKGKERNFDDDIPF